MEYSQGEADLGTARENIEVGGRGSDSIAEILSHGSIGGATIWGRDMGPHVFDVEETRGDS